MKVSSVTSRALAVFKPGCNTCMLRNEHIVGFADRCSMISCFVQPSSLPGFRRQPLVTLFAAVQRLAPGLRSNGLH